MHMSPCRCRCVLMSTCLCPCMPMSTCLCPCIHVHLHVPCMHMPTCMCPCMHVSTCLCRCMHMPTCMHVHLPMSLHLYDDWLRTCGYLCLGHLIGLPVPGPPDRAACAWATRPGCRSMTGWAWIVAWCSPPSTKARGTSDATVRVGR